MHRPPSQLEELAGRVSRNVGIGAAEIIQTHVLMLSDSRLRDGTEEHIRRELCNAEWALQMQLERMLLEFRSLDDEYIRSRGERGPGRAPAEQAQRRVADRSTMPDRLADTRWFPGS
jgi:phosphoenolpyruvate-protein kinase (PTS system EI component)